MEGPQAMAMTTLPGIKQPKKKRLQKNDIARSWSIEKQEEIREEQWQKRTIAAAPGSLTFDCTSLN